MDAERGALVQVLFDGGDLRGLIEAFLREGSR
jgi:hypothetical protein